MPGNNPVPFRAIVKLRPEFCVVLRLENYQMTPGIWCGFTPGKNSVQTHLNISPQMTPEFRPNDAPMTLGIRPDYQCALVARRHHFRPEF